MVWTTRDGFWRGGRGMVRVDVDWGRGEILDDVFKVYPAVIPSIKLKPSPQCINTRHLTQVMWLVLACPGLSS